MTTQSWSSPGQNTGVGSLSLLQGIFPTQGLNPGLPHYRQTPYQLSHQVSPLRGNICPIFWLNSSTGVVVSSQQVKMEEIDTCMLSHFMLCDSTDCCLPGSSVHGVLQARILKWMATLYPTGSSKPRGLSCVFCLLPWRAGCLQLVLPGKPKETDADTCFSIIFTLDGILTEILLKNFESSPQPFFSFLLICFIFVFFALYNVPTQHLNRDRALLRRESNKLKWVLRIFIPTRNIFPRTSHSQTMNLLYFWKIYILFITYKSLKLNIPVCVCVCVCVYIYIYIYTYIYIYIYI